MERKPVSDGPTEDRSSDESSVEGSARTARKRNDAMLMVYGAVAVLSLGLGIWVCASIPSETRLLVHSKHGNPIYLAPVAIFPPSILLVSFVIVGVRDRKNEPELSVKQLVGGLIALFFAALLFVGAQIGLAIDFWQEAGVL